MPRKALICSGLTLFACALLTGGCMPKMTIQEMKDQMPKRPVELDRLDAFVGKWQYEGEAKFAMLDEPIKSSGTAEYKWDGDRWYLVGHNVFDMEHFGKSTGLETWTYDTHDKKYRSTWVDSMGMLGIAETKYDEKTGTWHMKSRNYGAWGESTMKGWMKLPTPDTMEWSMSEHQGLMKVMEMTGTGKRVK